MKKLLSCLVLSFIAMAAEAHPIVGYWKAPQASVTLGGTAHFRSNGTFTLTPEGSGPATGKYELDGDHLVMRLDSSPQFPAEGVVEWLNKGRTMRIQFIKGPAQEFNRYSPKKGK